jgi:hypothetical protein
VEGRMEWSDGSMEAFEGPRETVWCGRGLRGFEVRDDEASIGPAEARRESMIASTYSSVLKQ